MLIKVFIKPSLKKNKYGISLGWSRNWIVKNKDIISKYNGHIIENIWLFNGDLILSNDIKMYFALKDKWIYSIATMKIVEGNYYSYIFINNKPIDRSLYDGDINLKEYEMLNKDIHKNNQNIFVRNIDICFEDMKDCQNFQSHINKKYIIETKIKIYE